MFINTDIYESSTVQYLRLHFHILSTILVSVYDSALENVNGKRSSFLKDKACNNIVNN